jgi:prepilin-type N-terminal cleavage/methylation domain-containing protein
MRVLKTARGFTAVEVVVAVTILALIAFPLAMTVTQALELGPEGNARSRSASNRFFMTDTWARDTLNSHTVTFPAQDNTPQNVLCPFWAPPGGSTSPVYEATWNDGSSITTVRYDAVFGYAAGSGPGTQAVFAVEIRRTENGAPATVARGTCDFAGYWAGELVSPVSVTKQNVAGDLHVEIRLVLRLRPAPGMPIETVDYEGALGMTK